MKIYDITDSIGDALAFEVNNLTLGRRGACEIAAGIAGAQVLRKPRALSWLREEVFCELELNGVRFQIAEPFGDNSRYWVGPVPTRPVAELAVVRNAFAQAGALATSRGAAG